ncbi:sigma-70 family RNA polymerase sigma factor [bacterium]|nr:sigma-70 family RNA polymerase sigma factor [bacterium]MBU1073338.1 sigma-70 family RNA polymerase sigma factor [bacterium]MBU1676453.1 sigma-70 family RNA polymerase sigma factor [bacterium]
MDRKALKRDIAAYVSGDDAAGRGVCATLDVEVRGVVYAFLSANDPDRDDIVQDTLLAILQYLRASGVSPDNPEAFAVTCALNRCRNLYHWRRLRQGVDIDEMAGRIPCADASPLDLLDAQETRNLLAEALASLDPDCRRLLRDIYLEETSIEILRRKAGLSSVQGIYHRKNICLKKVMKFFNRRRFGSRYTRRTRR